MYKINHANIKDWAKNYDGPLFDGILCDPPYEIGFMSAKWDSSGIAFDVEMWQSIYNLLKPGAHLLAFSGSRTYHRMAVAIEDAGFEIRDMIEWVYGSGFPKSLNIGKAVDKTNGQAVDWFGKWLREWRKENNIPQKEVAKLFPSKTGGLTGCVANWELGLNMPTNEQFNLICKTFNLPFENLEEAEREYVGKHETDMGGLGGERLGQKGGDITKGNSIWEGYGTALKPAHEPCVLARKPLDGTVANNVLKHGTGGLAIDKCRVTLNGERQPTGSGKPVKGNADIMSRALGNDGNETSPLGRFPANLIHDGSDEVVGLFPETKSGSGVKKRASGTADGIFNINKIDGKYLQGDSGSAARFFYCAKSSKSERNAGLEGFEEKTEALMPSMPYNGDGSERNKQPQQNHHPTVKPLSLTKYLANLIKPPTGGRLLVPFSGSGSEVIGGLLAGWSYVEGVELTQEYIPISEARIQYWSEKSKEENMQAKLWEDI